MILRNTSTKQPLLSTHSHQSLRRDVKKLSTRRKVHREKLIKLKIRQLKLNLANSNSKRQHKARNKKQKVQPQNNNRKRLRLKNHE